MPYDQILFFLIAGVVIFIIGLSKGGLGGAAGVLATPLMALVMPAQQVIGLLLPVLLLADVFAISAHWRRWDWRLARLLIPGSILGVTVATLFITRVPAQALKTGMGVITLLFAVYRLSERYFLSAPHYQARNWHGMLAGSLAGFASTVSHSGGPPVAVYLLLQEAPPPVFVATSALFFAIVNWIKVPYYFYAHLFEVQRLWQVLWLTPLLPLGVWFGKWMGSRVQRRTFEGVILVLLFITGLLLIFRQ